MANAGPRRLAQLGGERLAHRLRHDAAENAPHSDWPHAARRFCERGQRGAEVGRHRRWGRFRQEEPREHHGGQLGPLVGVADCPPVLEARAHGSGRALPREVPQDPRDRLLDALPGLVGDRRRGPAQRVRRRTAREEEAQRLEVRRGGPPRAGRDGGGHSPGDLPLGEELLHAPGAALRLGPALGGRARGVGRDGLPPERRPVSGLKEAQAGREGSGPAAGLPLARLAASASPLALAPGARAEEEEVEKGEELPGPCLVVAPAGRVLHRAQDGRPCVREGALEVRGDVGERGPAAGEPVRVSDRVPPLQVPQPQAQFGRQRPVRRRGGPAARRGPAGRRNGRGRCVGPGALPGGSRGAGVLVAPVAAEAGLPRRPRGRGWACGGGGAGEGPRAGRWPAGREGVAGGFQVLHARQPLGAGEGRAGARPPRVHEVPPRGEGHPRHPRQGDQRTPEVCVAVHRPRLKRPGRRGGRPHGEDVAKPLPRGARPPHEDPDPELAVEEAGV